MFPTTSRYYGLELANLKLADGREVAYVRRRFLPLAKATLLTEHMVTQDERLDNITAHYLGDPEQFWRVADANDALQPEALTAPEQIGHRLRIPLPQMQGGI
jgi:hypothetical protein